VLSLTADVDRTGSVAQAPLLRNDYCTGSRKREQEATGSEDAYTVTGIGTP
jgi:hypothetical protein